jgi:hypothetical protein
MSSSSFEMRSVGMASGLVVLLELRAGFPLGIDVKGTSKNPIPSTDTAPANATITR